MQFYRPLKLYFVVLLMCLSVVAQSPTPTPTPDPEAEKAALELEKGAIGLLDEAVAEAATLRLPENRALILTMAADALWSRDEKRARELFHQASDQVIAVVNSAPTGNSQIQQLILPFGREDLFSLRQMLLMTLARYDADLALEYLAATRPPDVAAELQEYYGSKSGSAARRSFFKAERELRFEESLIAQTTVQDPEKAAKLVRESLAKGQSSQILGLIFKIAEKDVGLANTLIGEVFSKTIESDLSKSINDYFFAISLLRTFSQPLQGFADQQVAFKAAGRRTPSQRPFRKDRRPARIIDQFHRSFAFCLGRSVDREIRPGKVRERQDQAGRSQETGARRF
ncbi:MAG: hypothetical protein IPK58_10075 [Acidobacteria bacterium]|nr:hypothetical protein [Acidobacteriota bacterium]